MAYFDKLSVYTADGNPFGVEISLSKTELANYEIFIDPDGQDDYSTIYWNGNVIWGEKQDYIDADGHTFKFSTDGKYNLNDLPEKGSGNNDPLTTGTINIYTPLNADGAGIDYVERDIQKKDSDFKIYVKANGEFGDWIIDTVSAEVKSRIHSYIFSRIEKIEISDDLKIFLYNADYPARVNSGIPINLPSLISLADENKAYPLTGKGYTLPLPDVNKNASYRFPNNYTHKITETDKHNKAIEVIVDFFDDTLQVYREANLSKPIVYKNNNVLSWGKVSNANVYQIYLDDLEYTTTTGTSFTIPDDLYYGEVHDWSIEALDSFKLECNATHLTGSDGSDIYAHPISKLKVYKQSSRSYWNNVGYVYAPIVKITRNALNSYSINVSDSTKNSVDVSLKYKIDNGATKTVSNNVINLTSLKPNTKYSYEIWAVGDSVESSHITGSFTTVKASRPNVSNAVRTEFNAYQITFSSVKNSIDSGIKDNVGTGVDRFDVYRNGIIYKSNATSPITVDGLKCNSENKIRIVSVFEKDASFNSEYTYTLDASKTPRLATPTIRKENVYENNVEVQFGSSKEISTKPVCTSINLKWDAIEFASGYLLRDEYREFDNDKQNYVEGVRYYPTQEEGKPTEYLTTTTYNIPMNNVKGYHLYTIQAIATDRVYNDLDKKSEYYIDEEYSSAEQTGTEDERTDQVRADMNFPLAAPYAEWDFNTTTVRFEPVPNADFYSIQLVPAGLSEKSVNLFRSFTLEPGQTSFTYNYYNMVKDLRETETYTATIIARSYNAFYFHPSPDSGENAPENIGLVKVIKLETPTNVEMNYNDTLSWRGDERAYQYEVFIKAIDGDWNSHYTEPKTEDTVSPTEYQFIKLAPSLHSFYVVSKRDNSLTNHQPVYLDSEPSEIKSKGTLIQPQNFKRYGNRFTWDNVGDDVQQYVFWDNFQSYTTVDGGGLSLELGMVDGEKYRPEEGHHVYQIQAIATINGVKYSSKIFDKDDDYSGDEHVIECDIEYLKQLTPYYPNDYESIINWDVLNEDVVYETKVNGVSEKDIQPEHTYVINDNKENPYDAGVYNFSVRSRSTIDEFLFQSSTWSENLVHNVIRLNRPDVVKTVELDDANDKVYKFSWNPVLNATSYRIYHSYSPNRDIVDENGTVIKAKGETYEEVIPERDTSYEIYLNAFPGAHTFYVSAVSLGSEQPIPTEYPNPRYIESAPSEMFNFGVLEEPFINIDGNTIYWNPIQGADYYTIYNYREVYSQTDDTRFNINLNQPYTFSLSVVASSLDEDTDDSSFSNSIEFSVAKLGTPKNLKLVGNSLVWDTVNNATAYNIYANEKLIAIPENTTSYDLTDFFNNNAGFITFYITAASNGEIEDVLNNDTGKYEYYYYLESDESNTVIKSITKEKKYNIVIEGVNYDDVQLPFTIHYTLDETLDDAQLTLAYIDRKEPFERLTPASVIIYEAGEGSDSYDMLIEADTVEDIQIGEEIKYKHSLTLIENTLKIQNEPVPDFTISRSRIKNILKIDTKEKLTKSKGNNIIPAVDFSEAYEPVAHAYWDYKGDHAKKEIDIFGVGETTLGDVYREYYTGENMLLPTVPYRLTSMCFNSREKTKTVWEEIITFVAGVVCIVAGVAIAIVAGWTGVGAFVGGFFIGYGAGAIVGEIIVLVETDGKKYEYEVEHTYLDSKWPYPGRKYYVRPSHPGVYEKTNDETEITSARQAINSTSLKNSYYVWPKSGTYDLIMEIPAINFKELADKNMLDTGNLFGDDTIPWPTNVDFMKDEAGNAKPYRVVWHGIRVVDKRSETIDGTTIGWALNKIIALVNQNKTTKEQYKLDPAIYALTANMECPDLTVSGGKYLYEVLEDLGREFNGLPRLLKDNTITFDILDSHTKSQQLHTFWKDANLLEIRKQDIEISSSGYVSQLSNMIPDEDYTIYPGYEMYSYPRGENNSAVVDVNSAAIVVDKPIYEIESVIVKDAILIKGQTDSVSDTPLDITQYVYEETVYNALNANNTGKGMALVWKQGDNKIRGLGQLPEQSAFYAAMNWEPEEYVINNIVDDAIAQAKRNEDGWQEKYKHNTPDKMRFQITYRGYINTTSFVENPDKKNDRYKMYTVLNQDANTISDKRFGNSALTQIKRHGTNIIEKSYIYTNLMFQPVLGASAKVGTDVYYINDITYEFANDYIRADCKFSKNYSRINPKVNVKTEYRQYELQEDNNVDRMINFNQYCTLGKKDSKRENKNFVNWENVLKNAFSKNTSYRPDTFYFNCYYNNSEERLQYLTTKDTASVSNDLERKNVSGIALPCNYTRIGTSIQFSAQMADSFSAGQAVRRANPKNSKDLGLLQSWVRYVGDTWIPDGAKSDSKLNLKTVNITDQTPYMRMTIGTLPNSLKTESTEMTYPEVSWLSQPEVSIGTPLFSKKFPVYKDSRERLGFNYQLHFLSNKEDLFIKDGFTKYLLRARTAGVKSVKPKLVAYTGTIGNLTTLNEYKSIIDVEIQDLSDYLNCKSDVIADRNYDGLAVIWPDTKEIMLELRKPIKKGEKLSYGNIYYNFSNNILS